jgi:hypothetical protein
MERMTKNKFENGFNSLVDLKRQVMALDTAEEREILVLNKQDASTNPTERYKAIFNIEKNRISTISSRRYKIIQHKEVCNNVIDILLDLGITCRGKINEYHEGDVVSMELYFTDTKYHIKDDSKEGVYLGIKVSNGYNLWNAVTLQLFAYRLVCSNGMMLGKVVENVSVKRVHIGKIDLPQLIRGFIGRVVEHNHAIKELISDCLQATLEWKIAVELLEGLIKTEKYRNILIAELGKLDRNKITKYDIYNLITRLASDNKVSLRESAVFYLQGKAQEVLKTNTDFLIQRYKKKKKAEQTV